MIFASMNVYVYIYIYVYISLYKIYIYAYVYEYVCVCVCMIVMYVRKIARLVMFVKLSGPNHPRLGVDRSPGCKHTGDNSPGDVAMRPPVMSLWNSLFFTFGGIVSTANMVFLLVNMGF